MPITRIFTPLIMATLLLIYSSGVCAISRVALLVPLQGPYAQSGQAIRDGFLAAYYQALPNAVDPPTIRIVDTSQEDILVLYRRAIEQGADFVVGPLDKTKGKQLIQKLRLPVPTLLLNVVTTQDTITNLYQFGLLPEDEAKQVAEKAIQEGYQNAIAIVPAGEWGQRVFTAFVNQWQAQGGRVVDEIFYDNPNKLTQQVAQLLRVTSSEQRTRALRRTLNRSEMRAIPHRRQDVDMIFLVAKPQMARQIRPLLRFYYAGNIPVYATSHIYSGTPDPARDKDLDGILFCAIPWEVALRSLPFDLQTIRSSIKKNWPQAAKKQAQFFALGVDSYRLMSLSSGISGMTGVLTLQPNQVWFRQLPWAKMVNGKPHSIQDHE